MPFLRSTTSALSMSPSASTSADLHSIMPAPVRSRSCLTSCALISAIDSSTIYPRIHPYEHPVKNYVVSGAGRSRHTLGDQAHTAGRPSLLVGGTGLSL